MFGKEFNVDVFCFLTKFFSFIDGDKDTLLELIEEAVAIVVAKYC